MATMTNGKETLFESVPCGRCGGSGKYSYCQMYGDRCFKCGGQGATLTKRGALASDYFKTLCSKRADELNIGDKVWEDGMFARGWAEVLETKQESKEDHSGYATSNGQTIYYFRVRTSKCDHGTTPGAMFRVAQSAADKTAKVAKALEYQNSLTKAGTVRKSA